MKTYHIIKIIPAVRIFLFFLLTLCLTTDKASGQLIEVKSWTGTYPDMNGSYPLTFIAFKGELIPIPHFFVRYYPTHNYKDLIAMNVIDATEIAGKLRTDILKSIFKIMEKSLMEGRFLETTGIKINTTEQKAIAKKIFNARFDQLEDIWQITEGFIRLYQKISRFDEDTAPKEIKRIFRKETDELFIRFLLVNLMESGHAQKIDSFSEISRELTRLTGETDYTFKKVRFFEYAQEETPFASYTFLTR
ncbi:MAG: hypothetical protein K0B11_21905 [Mariniphaga sp.]|nr:hypothetical protein [Mariniphaga sp.]